MTVTTSPAQEDIRLKRISIMLALSIAVLFPATFFTLSYEQHQTQQQINTLLLSQLSSRQATNPNISPASTSLGVKPSLLISSDSMIRMEPGNLRAVLINTAWASLLSFIMAAMVYQAFQLYPRRSLSSSRIQLERVEQKLLQETLAKEKALLKVEYSGDAIRHLASHDLLTDLPNRTHLESALREAITNYNSRGESFALMLLDLNRFKDINDSLGHRSGDLAMREVARRLQRSAPEPCTLARLDGDEFAIILPESPGVEQALNFANKVLNTLDQPLELKGYSLDTSATLGLALFPNHAKDADELIQRADVAMHIAKNSKMECMVYSQDMDSDNLTHLGLRGDLKSTIELGNLDVYFQPKIDLRSHSIVSVEALARWTHPKQGFVSPGVFIPIAEQSGLIHPLTGLVMNITLSQIAQWHLENKNINVAINLSVRSLHDTNLPQKLKVLLETWNIPANKIELEITESAIMAEPARALEILSELADMGIHISIDDYGTGYSSLSYIKRLPVKEIKIDRSFVMDMMENDNDSVIVRATIDMAHDLGLSVTAEGVENQATWEKLSDYGCDFAQGFHMGKPLPAHELDIWLHESRWGLHGRPHH